MILNQLKDHENVIKLKHVLKAKNNKDIYLVFEFMETDLHAVIKIGILKTCHKQYIIY
jgi:mitogen-activated protein kinase 15